MSGPKRVQRKRRRGWRMPAGAVYVGRSTEWGNPFRITRSSEYHGLRGSWFLLDGDGTTYHPDEDTERSARRKAVDLYAAWLDRPGASPGPDRVRTELAGHDLVCWCPRGEPCHADVLLALANTPAPADRRAGRGGDLPGWVAPTPVGRACPRCGDPRSRAARVPQPIDGDLSVTGLTARVTCASCGHERDVPDPTA